MGLDFRLRWFLRGARLRQVNEDGCENMLMACQFSYGGFPRLDKLSWSYVAGFTTKHSSVVKKERRRGKVLEFVPLMAVSVHVCFGDCVMDVGAVKEVIGGCVRRHRLD